MNKKKNEFLEFYTQEHMSEIQEVFERTYQHFDVSSPDDFKEIFKTTEHYSILKLHAASFYLRDLEDSLLIDTTNPDNEVNLATARSNARTINDLLFDARTISDLFFQDSFIFSKYIRHMRYGYSSHDSVGNLRPYSEGIGKGFHHYFFSEDYIVFCLVNPVFIALLNYAQTNSINVPTLERLVHDKDSLYQEIMLKIDKPEDFVESCIINSLYNDIPEDLQIDQFINLNTEILLIRETLYKEHRNQQSNIFIYLQKKKIAAHIMPLATQYLHCLYIQNKIVLDFRAFVVERVKTDSFFPIPGVSGVLSYVLAHKSSSPRILKEFNLTIKPFSMVEVKTMPQGHESLLSRYYDALMLYYDANEVDLMSRLDLLFWSLEGKLRSGDDLKAHHTRNIIRALVKLPKNDFNLIAHNVKRGYDPMDPRILFLYITLQYIYKTLRSFF